MNDRKEITQHLTELIKSHINPYNDPRIYTASEVTFDYNSSHSIRVDYMQFKPLNNSISGIEKGSFYCYEVKSCKDDFESGNGLNFIGDYNYLVMPKDLYDIIKDKIPYDVGVYASTECDYKPLMCIKKAKRRDRSKSLAEMLLMMFRSSNRELLKMST